MVAQNKESGTCGVCKSFTGVREMPDIPYQGPFRTWDVP